MDSENKPHVEIFGNTMDYGSCGGRWGHRHDSGGPIFGVMFLLAGIMLFLNVIGQVPWSVWHVIWQFWPVILIFIGVQILSGVILFLLALFVFGVIFLFSLQSVGSPLVAHMNLPWWIASVLTELRRVMPLQLDNSSSESYS